MPAPAVVQSQVDRPTERWLPLGFNVQATLHYEELARLSDRFAAALAGLPTLVATIVADGSGNVTLTLTARASDVAAQLAIQPACP